MYRTCLILFLLCAPLQLAYADQITLKNGDRLTGEAVKSDGKTLTFKTEFVGTIEIQWDAIQNFSSENPVFVENKTTSQTVSGPVKIDNNSVVVSSSTGQVTLDKGEVAALRSPAEQTAYEKSQHPGLLEGWKGGANVGFSLTRGNSETKNLALGFEAIRTGLRDKLRLYANSVYNTNDAPGAIPGTTANLIQGGLSYQRDLTKKLFAFGNADFMSDALQDLNLRSVLGGGLGLHAIKSDTTTLDFLGGANYTHESYVQFSRNFAGLTLGEEFMHAFHNTTLTQRAYFYPNLSDTGEYRATFDLGTVTKINSWLGWQNSISDIYVTNPPAGNKQNDLVLTSGFTVSFSH